MTSILPNEIWSIIVEYLEVIDVVNFCHAFPTLIDVNENLYQYLPLYRIREWFGDIADLYKLCDDCASDLQSNIEDMIIQKRDEYGLKKSEIHDILARIFSYENGPYLNFDYSYENHDRFYRIYTRSFMETAYKNRYKSPIINLDNDSSDDDCICHGDENKLHQKVLDETDDLCVATYCHLLKYNLEICYKCGGVGHEEYDEGCLFRSNKLMADFLDAKREREKRREEQKKQAELKRANFLKTACFKCQKNIRSSYCDFKLCGACCDNCSYHILRQVKRSSECYQCKTNVKSKTCINSMCGKCCHDSKCTGAHTKYLKF